MSRWGYRWLVWGVLLCFAVALVYLNGVTPFWSDDYVYRFVFDARYYYDESFSRLVSSWADVVESQWAHYMCPNGRVVAHTLAQLFLWLGPGLLWSVANTVCFCVLGWLMWRFAAGSSKGGRELAPLAGYGLTLGLYWLLLPHHGQLLFWLTGSCNYQWSALLVMGMLNLLFLPVRRGWGWLLFPVALLAGNGNEALSLGLALALGGYAVFRRKELCVRQCVGMLCFFAGTASNVFSPGAAARLEMAGEGVAEATLPERVVNAWEDVSRVLEQWPHLLVIPFGAMVLAMWPRGRSRYRAWLLLAALLSLALATYVRMIDPRATFGYFLYACMAALPVVLTLVARLPRRVQWGLAGVMVLVVAGQMVEAAYAIPRFAAYERSLVDAARAGNDVVVPQQGAPWSRFAHNTFLTENCTGMHNRAVARWFGTRPFGVLSEGLAQQVRGVPEGVYAGLQPGEYARAGEGVFVLRFEEWPTTCHATGYHVPAGAPAALAPLRYWRGLSCVVQERGGAPYVLVFYDAAAQEAGVCEIRVRVMQGHELHWLTLDARQERGVAQPGRM